MFSQITSKIFSSSKINKFESVVIYFSILTMLIHFLFIFFAKQEIIVDQYLKNQSYLEVVATPFTIILIYEIFLLVISVSKSLSISLGKQYEIIALVLIRDVFKIISVAELNNPNLIDINLILTIGFDIFFAVLCFVGIAIYYRGQSNCQKLLEKQEKEKQFVELKAIGSLILLFILLGFIFNYIISLFFAFDTKSFFSTFKELEFIGELFVFMIIVDVVLLLITFNKSHNFRDIFYEAVLIISAIVVRFAFVSAAPLNGILAMSGILIASVITFIYSKVSKYMNY